MLNKEIISKYMVPLSPLKTDMKKRGKFTNSIKCILFDIYGTLFISGSGDISIARTETVQLKKILELLNEYSIYTSPEIVMNDFFKAIEKKHLELKSKGIDFPEVNIDRIWMDVLNIDSVNDARQFASEYELLVNPVYPMPNLKEMLSGIMSKGIHLGIISNAQFFTPFLFPWFLGNGLDKLGFDLDLCFFSYKYKYAKPSNFLYNLAVGVLKKKGLPVESTVFIGNDMKNDIYPAQNAGFQTALFAGDRRSLRLRKNSPECRNVKPDVVITDLIQLLEYTG